MKNLPLFLITVSLAYFTACKKNDPTPTPSAQTSQPSVVNHGTCTYTINGTTVYTADSIHWDNYNGTTPRVQAFTGTLAVITLWPGSATTHTQSLTAQYVYWFAVPTSTTAIYTASTGSLNLVANSNVLSGTLSSNGTKWSGSGAATSTITASFSDVRKIGL